MSSAGNLSRINAALQRALALEETEGPGEQGMGMDIAPNPDLVRLEDDALDMGDLTEDMIASEDILERAKYVPLRLSYEERKALRLVNAAINVSNYTSVVDKEFKSQSRRHHQQLQHICAFLSGLVSAHDYADGQDVLSDRNFVPFEAYLQEVLEIARRYKIMNPEKMRSEYGKLIYLMQDANAADVKPLLGFDAFSPIKTVYNFLEERRGLGVLSHVHISLATKEILPDKSVSRDHIQRHIKQKNKAIEIISREFVSRRLSQDDIKLCMYSVCDNNSFLNSNVLPVDECIDLLVKYFHPSVIRDSKYSLAISDGSAGARLSHSHDLQFNYVLQSLTLWSTIVRDMFRLWYLAESDLLSTETPYELKQTGQGLHRVQTSPRVYRAMHEILHHTKKRLCEQDGGSGWIGSSVIHLGDNMVPNALVFIDKYTQVSRILGPIIMVLKNLEAACEENEGLGRYIESYGGLEKAKKDVLQDFFTHAFDGSGGDNFFDAGSCIDGRLTSAWNWCSQLSSKPYYPLFRLTGFLSFDGEFDK
jgi:hypothetical protein